MKSFSKFFGTKKPKGPDVAITASEDLSETASLSSSSTKTTDSTATQSSKKRQYVAKIIQTLAERPKAFGSMLDLAQTGSGVLNVSSQLAGTRYEIAYLASSFGTKGMVPGLLRNGLLEELASIEPAKAAEIIDQIFEHNFIKQQLANQGLNNIPPQAFKGNANLLVSLAATLKEDQSTLSTLSDNSAKFIENAQKISDLESKKTKNYEQKIADLKEKQTENITEIRGNLLQTLDDPYSKAATLALINGVTSTIAKAVDSNDITLKLEAFKDIARCDDQISKSNNEAEKTRLLSARNLISTSAHITPFDEVTFNLRKALQLKPAGKLENLANVGLPVISSILAHTENLRNITSAYDAFSLASPNNNSEELTGLIKSGMALLQHPDILTTIMDPKTQKAVNNELESDLEVFAKQTIDTLKKYPTLLDTAMGDEGLKAIAPKILDLPSTHEALGITKEQADQYKAITSDVIDYGKAITNEALTQPIILQSIAQAYKSYKAADNEDKPRQLVALANSGIELLNNPEILTKIADKQQLRRIAGPILAPKDKAQALAAIDIACDNKEYFLAVANSALKQPEMIKVLEDLQTYQTATPEVKPEKLIALANSAVELVNNPQVEAALLNPNALDKIITQASQSPALKELFSSFKEDLSSLKEALRDSTPSLLKVAKKGLESEGAQALLIKAAALTHTPMDNDKVKALASDAITLYSNSKIASTSINDQLQKESKNIAKIIDQSLSSVNKNSIKLRLLKPLGINGEFIVSMLQKVNNKEGLEAIKTCIENPNLSNGLKILSSTGTRSLVIGHMIKSATQYLFSSKAAEKPKQLETAINSDVINPITKETNWVNRIAASTSTQEKTR